MQTDQSETGMLQGLLDSPPRRAWLDRKTELRIELTSGDVIVSVRLDARRKPEHHLCPLAFGDDLPKELDLVLAVDDDRRAGAIRGVHVLATLVVAQKVDAVLREPRAQREMKLAGRDHVETQSLFRDNPEELGRSECLGRVENLARGAHGGGGVGGARPNRRLVGDATRRAVLAGKLH